MTEKLLQFLWQFQYLNPRHLTTIQGEPLEILHPGQLNNHQGPDFFDGRVRIGDTLWAGHIELHVLSSDWTRHGHQLDEAYGKVILHVVWRHDAEISDPRGNAIPTFEMEPHVPVILLSQVDQWMQSAQPVPCRNRLHEVSDLVWTSWLDRLLAERLLDKVQRVRDHLAQTRDHWDEAAYRLLGRYLGGPVNAVSFEQITASLPLETLLRHRACLPQLEALLIGQAGLLHKGLTQSYPAMLYREYQHLQRKYGLRVVNRPPQFLRMRPGNFPTLRLAQLAALIHTHGRPLSAWLQATGLNELRQCFDVTANDFWNEHYMLDDEASASKPKRLGRDTTDRLIANAVVPVCFAYGHQSANDELRQRALRWLEALPPESNQYTRSFAELGRAPRHAADAQAVLTLRQHYCDAKRCLDCAVGHALLGRAKTL